MTREELPVKNGFEYDVYFPKAMGGSITKKKGATVVDTIRFIPQVVNETRWQTMRFSKEVIKADTLYQTCKNIWDFVFNHIAYKKDEDGKEQVRSPARTWRDRHNYNMNGSTSGVDCDCYTVFISSILSNLNIRHVLRITKYGEDHFQHIYPIVPIGNGRYIKIDCVVKSFDYEEPYTEKKDTAMDLEYLNGVSDSSNRKNNDAEDLIGMMSEREAMAELGKIFKRKASAGSSGGSKPKIFQRKTTEQKQERKAKIKQFINKGLHVTNRLNPATASIRAGVLAAMKLNFMKIGSQLRYTYLSNEEAQKRGIDMGKFAKMKNIREKLEKIFYGAGGKPENLKKAILTGKGNSNKEVPVNGLGYIPYENVDGLNEDLSLSQLLGTDMMSSESMHEVSGLGELGEPATAASIAAASTVLTTIVALIKNVGSLFPKKKEAGSEKTETNASESGGSESSGGESNSSSAETETNYTEPTTETSTSNSGASKPSNTNSSNSQTSNATTSSSETATEETTSTEEEGSENLPAQRTANTNAKETATTNAKEGTATFWDKNKKWIKPTSIAVGSLGLIALAYQIFKPKKEVKKTVPVNGIPPKKNKPTKKHLLNGLKSKGKKTTKASTKPKKKSAVTLL